jgi:LmbE family N-acetylglucosaminyl deacetylase
VNQELVAPRVLALFAHPDDETFGPGATLARLAAEGCRVHLVCATRGEAGTIGDSASHGPQRLGALRVRELHRACEALGMEPPELLGLPDGGLAALPPEALLRPFVEAVRRLRPRLIVSFDAGGVSGHPDHRTVTARAAAAFDLAAEAAAWPELGPPHAAARLWGYTVPESRAREVTWRTLQCVPDEAIDARIEVLSYLPAKHAAVDAHATQKPFIEDLSRRLGGVERFWNPECFVLERSREPHPGTRPVEDLFAGLEAEPGG